MSTGVSWDLTSYFEEFDNEQMRSFKKDLKGDIERLIEKAAGLGPLGKDTFSEWKAIVLENEGLARRLSHLASYIVCLASADANNEAYSKEYAELDGIGAESSKIEIHLKMALKKVGDDDFRAFIAQEGLDDLAFHLSELRKKAQKTMSGELETLAADLSTDGYSAWGRLYSTIAGKLQFEMHFPDGKVESTPISQCRSLMQDSDREVRRSAFEHGNAAWRSVEDVCAAAVNSIAGTRLLLNERRGLEHFLDAPLMQSRTSRRTLDAMFGAIEDCKGFIQRLGKAKAKALGLEKLAWFDCEAPLSIPGVNRYSWEECERIVSGAFERAYPELAGFFREAIEKRWVESEPTAGKRPGAFCTGSYLTEESRVFMSYNGSFSDIATLAHEIGHAFHARQLKGLRPYLRSYPMTLAESASTFAELLLNEGVLRDPESTDAQKLGVLTGTVNHCLSFLVDIPIRFYFEKSFHEERADGIVSVSRLKSLMKSTMENQFGDLLEEGGADELFWASKMHFYITGVSFYNYPYTFGYLLSRGLFDMFKKEGQEFLPKYRDFLRLSGSAMGHEVARQTLGADLEEKDFWRTSIMSHEQELELFEELVPKVLR